MEKRMSDGMRKKIAVTALGQLDDSVPEGKESCENAAGYADFSVDADGNAVLLRWPRNTERAVLPERIGSFRLTAIAPLAFAAFHFPEDAWEHFEGGTSLSFSVFCLINAGKMLRETSDDGGPVEVMLPDSIEQIGKYAFWHCDRLRRVKLPQKLQTLEIGLFGECSRLEEVVLPGELRQIGHIYENNVHVMPDVGSFSGCHALKQLRLPKTVTSIGAEAFNSCGLEHLIVEDDVGEAEENGMDKTVGQSGRCRDITSWMRRIETHASAFDHTAALQWMSRCVNGKIVWQIGLPAARDKILTCDERFRVISGLPRLFLKMGPEQLDEIAKDAFRLDFSGRMAIARLRYPEGLSQRMKNWYVKLLVEYSDRLEKFWPEENNKEEQLFALLKGCDGLDAQLLGRLMEIAGRNHAKPELIYDMMELRNRRFSRITGMECLEL